MTHYQISYLMLARDESPVAITLEHKPDGDFILVRESAIGTELARLELTAAMVRLVKDWASEVPAARKPKCLVADCEHLAAWIIETTDGVTYEGVCDFHAAQWHRVESRRPL